MHRSRPAVRAAFSLASSMLLVVMGSTTSLSAGSLEINLSGDAARARFATALRVERLELDASWLHVDDGAEVPSVGLHVVDLAGDSGAWLVGVGAELLFVDFEALDGGALALGGFVRFQPAMWRGFGVAGRLHYAPEVSSFGDTSDVFEYSLRALYQILEETDVYVGYRKLRAEFDPLPRRTLDDGFHVGFQFRF